jgi:hypothetical protein
MYMAGVSDEKDLQQAQDILVPLGEYFQIQVPIQHQLTLGRFHRLLW